MMNFSLIIIPKQKKNAISRNYDPDGPKSIGELLNEFVKKEAE